MYLCVIPITLTILCAAAPAHGIIANHEPLFDMYRYTGVAFSTTRGMEGRAWMGRGAAAAGETATPRRPCSTRHRSTRNNSTVAALALAEEAELESAAEVAVVEGAEV